MRTSSNSAWITIVIRAFMTLVRLIVTRLQQLIISPEKGKIPPIRNEILLTSATDLAEQIRNGKCSSKKVVRCFIDRLKEINPIVNGMVEDCFIEAIQKASVVDEYIVSSGKKPSELAKEKPLLGVPVTVKSNIACEGYLHECGLLARKGVRADEDAAVVRLIKDAGAIVICMSNVPELCTSFNSYNKIYGLTKNPHDLTKIAGGSSGGECALVSTGASVIGIGNDLCGSLRMPASLTGIFSHKPTSGTISNTGMFPPTLKGKTVDTVLVQGPLSRYSRDLLTVMKCLTANSNISQSFENPVDFKNIKVLYCDDDSADPTADPVSKSIKTAIKRILSFIRKKYGIVPKKVSFPGAHLTPWILSSKNKGEETVKYTSWMTNDPKKDINIWAEVAKCFLGLSNHTFESLKFGVLNNLAPPVNSTLVKEYDQVERQLRTQFESLVDNNTVLICPSWPVTSCSSFDVMYQDLNMSYYTMFGLLGTPVTQCPVGLDSNGYPIGIQVAGARFQDNLTISFANEIEKEFGGWLKPCRVDVG